ncbi:uncharacterized protein KZ484_003857 [Pholidichthys leucotaenia]
MNSAVFAFTALLLVVCAQGQLSSSSNKCKCLNGFIGRIMPGFIKSGPVIYDKSIFCPRIEIIVTTAAGKEKCVNPKSELGRRVLERRDRQQKKEAVRTTTAATYSSTRSSLSPSTQAVGL